MTAERQWSWPCPYPTSHDSLSAPATQDPAALLLPLVKNPRDVLHQVFGHAGFRGLQEEVVNHVVDGGDAVVLFPTGAGKSICYQVPALCRPGVGIVVSPLIALMRDQVEALRQQ